MIIKSDDKLYSVSPSAATYHDIWLRKNGDVVNNLHHQIHASKTGNGNEIQTNEQATKSWLDSLTNWKEIKCISTKHGGTRVVRAAPAAAS